MNIFDSEKKEQQSSFNLFFRHSKAVALTVLAGLAFLPEAQAGQKTSVPNKPTVKQSSSKKNSKDKTTKKTVENVKDVYPEDQKPLSLAKDEYYQLVFSCLEDDIESFQQYFRSTIPQLGHAIKSETPMGLAGHLELAAVCRETVEIYDGPECHSDILIFKDIVKKILADNEDKKARWEKYQADQSKKASKKDSKTTTKPKKPQQTKLPLIEERYLDRLLSEVNHPEFDRFITSFYTPNWLTFHAEEMKKSKSCTPEKAEIIDQVHQKYLDIFEKDCNKSIEKFKTKVQEIYSQNKVNAKVAQYTSPILMEYRGIERA